MRFLQLWAFIGLIFWGSYTSYCQYDIGYTHYMCNEFFVNPGYTGSKDALSLNVLGRFQWVGFDGAPNTFTFNGHAPVAKQHLGIGAGVLYDQIGVGKHASGYINIAGRLLFPKNVLALGVQTSFGGQSEHYEDLKNVPDLAGDNLLVSEPMKFIPNMGFGLYFYSRNYYIGFSVPRVLNNNYIENQNKRFNFSDWTYYFNAGYVFEVSPDFSIMPSAMLKVTQGVGPQLNVSALALCWNTLWLGADYRTDNSLSPMVGVQLNKYFRLNYSYEIQLDSRRRTSLGASHEISLMYTFDYLKRRIVSPRLF